MDTTDPDLPIRTVLVANRGEIALRVIRACRAARHRAPSRSTPTSTPRRPHVRAADEAVRVDSYLDIDAVVAAARRAGADADPPGLRLPLRARRVRPRRRGRRARAGRPVRRGDGRDGPQGRAPARSPSRPASPSSRRTTCDDDPADVRLPGAGQGGRRRRRQGHAHRARAPASYDDGGRRREAGGASRVRRRHDPGREVRRARPPHRGAGARPTPTATSSTSSSATARPSAATRRCSRRRPAPTITADVRGTVTERGGRAGARRSATTNAGTVEFLLDDDTGEVYFLEMNTRLQVEHPVTEAGRPGVDLVELQLAGRRRRAAAVRPGRRDRDRARHRGPGLRRGLVRRLPAAGRHRHARAVAARRASGSTHALESGQVVSTSYDPMLGKVIAHGPDREAARRALVAALDDTAILGLTTNAGFLRALAASDEFRDATIDTAWLDRHDRRRRRTPTLPRVFAAWIHGDARRARDTGHPFQADGWRSARPRPRRSSSSTATVRRSTGPRGTRRRRARCSRSAPSDHVARARDRRPPRARRRQRAGRTSSRSSYRGQRHVLRRGPTCFADHVDAVGDGTVTAPMPGTVLDVRVADGRGGRRGRGARRDGGDEDGAVA